MGDMEASGAYYKDGQYYGKSHHNSNNVTDQIPHITSFASLSDLTDTDSAKRRQAKDDLGKGLVGLQSEEEDVYIVQQKHGYFSIAFSTVQVIVLGCMMWQCGIAPMNINPMFGPYPDALSYWGGKNAVLIIDDGEYWRLVTPIFLHAGLIHLFCNVSVQMETGAFFEREWGSATWLIVYLVSALGSSILSCVSMPDSVSVGSSGAVMGLFGAKLSEVFCRACESRRTRQDEIAYEVRMDQLGGVLCSLAIVGLFSFIPYVDWAAHLGGLLAGQTVGLIIFSARIRSWCWKTVWSMAGIALTIIGFFVAIGYMLSVVEPAEELRDVCGYYKQYFDDYECNCQLEDKD